MKPSTSATWHIFRPANLSEPVFGNCSKASSQPYKSVLKLLLTEVYASEHPSVHCLSLRFKRAGVRQPDRPG